MGERWKEVTFRQQMSKTVAAKGQQNGVVVEKSEEVLQCRRSSHAKGLQRQKRRKEDETNEGEHSCGCAP